MVISQKDLPRCQITSFIAVMHALDLNMLMQGWREGVCRFGKLHYILLKYIDGGSTAVFFFCVITRTSSVI